MLEIAFCGDAIHIVQGGGNYPMTYLDLKPSIFSAESHINRCDHVQPSSYTATMNRSYDRLQALCTES